MLLTNRQKDPILDLEGEGTCGLFTLFSTLIENVPKTVAEVAPTNPPFLK